MIGRGHAERLVPLIDEMLDGHVPSRILVGVGPGSFTGIRVAIAAAHGLAIGWSAHLDGFSSLALLAAGVGDRDEPIAAAVRGGHGQLFVQQFAAGSFEPDAPVQSLVPEDAARLITASRVSICRTQVSVSLAAPCTCGAHRME